jgi:hypothetical protein
VRVDLGVISEDLRRRVLTAIATELERDEAERQRNVQEQGEAGDRGFFGVLGTEHATGAGDAADDSAASTADDGAAAFDERAAGMGDGAAGLGESAADLGDTGPATGYGVRPANGSGASTGNGSGAGLDKGGSTGWDHLMSGGPDYRVSASPGNARPWERDAPWDRDVPWDRDALWPVPPGQPGDTPDGEAVDREYGAAEDAAAALLAGAAGREDAPDAADAADGPDEKAPGPVGPLPRRAPGTHGAPPPPAELRREYLPPSLLGRRLDPEAYTEPLPRIAATSQGSGPASGGAAATDSDQPAPSIFSPAARTYAPPASGGPPAGPESAAPGPSSAASRGQPAEPVPPEAPSARAAAPDSAPPQSAASPSALAAASAPTMPVGNAALTATSARAMAAGSAALAAATGFAPPAGTAQPGTAQPGTAQPGTAQPEADLAPPAELAAPSGLLAPAPAAPSPMTSPPPLPAPPTPGRSRPPAASLPAPSDYGWTADPGGLRPRTGRGVGPAVPLSAARPAAKRSQGSGRPYRIAGVILAVVALVVAGVIALLLSGGNTSRHGTSLGPPAGGAGALVRQRAAAWVAGQVSRAAVVACDPVMCQALMAHGVAENRLYQLGPQTTSPLRSQVIVATAAVRARFDNVLSSVYAPAMLASFGSGADRVDIRVTAHHGAAAYRAMLSSDMASRKASGTQLLHSGRIAAAAIARRELVAGAVDGRLLITIAQIAAAHPLFIVDFGSPAPGADPDMPLRQADLAEDVHAHHAGRAISAGYVRAIVSFLRTQHGAFRPAQVRPMRLPDGVAVLRIEFTAPSPLGLLGPHA